MNNKKINLTLLLCGLIILMSSLFVIISMSDPALFEDLADAIGFEQVKAFSIAFYLLVVSIPVGYALSAYYCYKKAFKPSYFDMFWGVILLVFIVLQVLVLSLSSPLQWAILILSGLLLVIHVFMS